jgi:hypothetical protein
MLFRRMDGVRDSAISCTAECCRLKCWRSVSRDQCIVCSSFNTSSAAVALSINAVETWTLIVVLFLRSYCTKIISRGEVQMCYTNESAPQMSCSSLCSNDDIRSSGAKDCCMQYHSVCICICFSVLIDSSCSCIQMKSFHCDSTF